MKVCPTGGLQPAWTEAGLEGLWTPRLVPRIGHCDYNCNLCGQVCPTEAIQPLTIAEKQKMRIGLAAFDTTPLHPLRLRPRLHGLRGALPDPGQGDLLPRSRSRRTADGEKKTIKQPRVDPKHCIGCGICENVCPFKDQPAVRVSSANESRNPDNQPILPGDDQSPY